MDDPDDSTDALGDVPFDNYAVRRRAFLKAAGVGAVGATTLSGTAAASSHYDGPFSRTYAAETVDPDDINVLPSGTTFPDGEGEGEEIDKTVPRKAPEADGNTGGPSQAAQTSAAEGGLVDADFDGLSALDVRGVVPSDNQIAAGPDALVQAINSQVAFFEKDGTKAFQASLDAFFAPVSPLIDENDPGAGFFDSYIIFDPRARYDPDSGRFLVACVDFSLQTAFGAMLLAVSSSSDPAEPWYLYRVPPIAQQGANPTPGLVDYPELGYDDDAVYITQNFFSGGFDGATMVALDKADATSGATADANHFTDLRNPDGSLAFTVQPADGGGYFANSTFFQGQTITVWEIGDPVGSSPSLSHAAVRVDPYTNPPDGANQPDTEEKIDMGDDRVLRVNYDGDSVWAAHTIDDGRARWYEIDTSGASPSLVQSGAFRVNGEKTFFPSIASTGDDAAFVYNTASPEGDGDGYVSVGVASVAYGEVTRYETVKDGENDYDYVDPGEGDAGTQTLRWGDYNGIETDPVDGGFWVVGQYAKQVDLEGDLDEEFFEDNFYGTRIARVTVPDDA